MATLVLICGRPASGKTTVAQRLSSLLQDENRTVSIVSDGDTAITNSSNSGPPDSTKDHQRQPRNVLYRDSYSEKQTRAQLRSLAERALTTPQQIVIVDSLNYIKGFRYELYCVAKTANASYIVIHTTTSSDICSERDEARASNGEDSWGSTVRNELNQRFETPNANNRWDKPLFNIDTTSDSTSAQQLEQIIKVLRTPHTKLQATMATREQLVPAANALADIDAATRKAEATLVSQLRSGSIGIGDSIRIPGATDSIRLQRKPRITELRDMRRAFLNYSRIHPPDSKTLVDAYVQYLNEQLTVVRSK